MSPTIKLVATAILLLVASAAGAATCTVTAISLAFGNYDSLRRPHTDSTGNIAVTCSGRAGELVAYSIALSPGAGSFEQRAMRTASGSTLSYNIYSTAARSLVWGDGNRGSVVVADSFRLGGPSTIRNHAVYGRAFRGQKVLVGVYNDAIVVTLDF